MEPPKPALEPDEVDRLYAVARLYYEEGLDQSSIAQQLQVSRPTISRMLSQARELGMVTVTVTHPDSDGRAELAEQLRQALALDRVYLAQGMQPATMGLGMLEPVTRALQDMHLRPQDSLVVASGLALHGIAQMELPRLDGVRIVPAVGGVYEPEAWHQTHEIVRLMAQSTHSTFTPLFAGAMPSETMYQALQKDEAFAEVRRLWSEAQGALLGIGSPTTGRTSLASVIPKDSLPDSVGDVCLHFMDKDGAELEFPGSERTVRIPREDLARIPCTTAVAVGAEKVVSIITACGTEMVRRLVTDESTARLVLERLQAPETVRAS